MFGAPLAFLILLETTLRLIGYGYPSTFLIPQENGTLGTNTKFAWRFFDPQIARIPEAIAISPTKPANTKRIFVLGGSAAQGVPHSAYSFSRLLEVMLDTAYPEQRFEIYNVAMTAINSHVVLPIARECAKLDPDLFIVYMGNNEVVGPYGPGSVITAFQPNLSIIRSSVRLKGTKTGQLLSDLFSKLGNNPSAPTQWTGMDIFVDKVVSQSDPRLESVYSHFQSNLEDIIEAGRRAGATVLVSTVASNLKDSPPFSSLHSPGLSESEQLKVNNEYERVTDWMQQCRYDEALALIEGLRSIDPQFALLAYAKARCYEQLGRRDNARQAYSEARDLDALRFRADSILNERLRETVREFQDEGVVLFDAERAFGGTEGSTQAIAGNDEFFEHVHFTFEGSFTLAKGLLEKMPEALPELVTVDKVGPPSFDDAAAAIGWNDWGKIQQLDGILPLIDRPPFTYQMGHDKRMSALKIELDQYYAAVGTDNGMGTIQSFKNALERRPVDPYLHQLIGEMYFVMNRFDEAQAHIETCLDIHPNSHDTFMQMAYIYFRSGRVEESIPYFRQAIELSPHYLQTQVDLASALAHLERYDEAEAICKQTVERQPKDAALQFGYGYVLLQAGKWDQAEERLLKAFSLEPDAFHLRQILDPKLRAEGKRDLSRVFDDFFIAEQSDRNEAYGQLIDYYFDIKDIPSVKYYKGLHNALSNSEE
tara:strand:- start:136 stop:2259 length:2124 start_codon:yes stop_codon:yes gene_type:complete